MKKKLTLNITTNYFCNQKCFFCIDNDKQHLTFLKKDINKKIYDMIKNWVWEYENIVFTSWEPTLNKNFGNYIRYAKKLWYKEIWLITNGSLLYLKEVRDEILFSGLDNLVVSIHWLWKIHDKMVGINWIFNIVLKWLLLLLKEKIKLSNLINIQLSFVMNKFNFEIYYKYINYFFKIWINKIIINTLRPEWYSSWKKYRNFFFSYNDFINFNKNLKKEQLKLLNSFILSRKLVITDMLPCVMYQSWLRIKWMWSVEIRKSFSSENKKNWFNDLKTYDKIEKNELIDDNTLIKTHIYKCYKCKFKNNCEWIYIDYLLNFWDDWIKKI